MSEDVIGKLGSFTPTALDRDAILFAAGRASARASNRWKWIAGTLVVTQAVTLGLWLAPRPTPHPTPHPVDPTRPRPAPPPETIPEPSFDPSSIYVLSRDPDRPSRSVTPATAPGGPTLSAFSRDIFP